MTIRLLSTYDGFAPQSILTLDPAIESALIADGNASATLTGGTVAYRERYPLLVQPAVQKHGSVALIANRKAIVPLAEGTLLTITPAAGTTGTYQRYAAGVAVGALVAISTTPMTVGAFEGDFTVEIKCTTGSLTAKVGDAVLGAGQINQDQTGIQAANGGPTLLINKKRNRNKPVVLGALMPTAVSTAFTGTHNLMMTAPGDFDAVAAVAINYDVSAPFLIDGVAFAVSERSDTSKTVPVIGGISYNALAGATDQLGFVPGTWSGSSTVSVPAATAAASGSGVVIPNFVMGDLIPLSSIPRVDNPAAFPLVICRQQWTARTVSVFSFANAADVDALNTVMAPYEFYQVAQTGVNGATAPSTFTSTWAAGSSTLSGRILALAFRLRGTGEFILVGGDSIKQGIAANGDTNPNKPANNWNGYEGLTAKALASKTRPVGYLNIAFSGMKSADYMQRLAAAIPVLKPSIVSAPPFTPNDPNQGSVATLSKQMAQALTLADVCEQNQAELMLVTGTPGGGASYAAQFAFTAKINSLRQVGVMDIFTQLADATNNAQSNWKAAYYFDGTHPNLLAHQDIATFVTVPKYKTLLGAG